MPVITFAVQPARVDKFHTALVFGALCFLLSSLAYAMGTDYGDAPDSYGLASHSIVDNAPHIGGNPPDADDGTTSKDADVDDHNASVDDEDGVSSFPVLVEKAKAYRVNVFVTNLSGADATLMGWVDFNLNGIFEPFEAASVSVANNSNHIEVELDWPALKGISTDATGQTYARFRISTDPIPDTSASGDLSNGEVEDYTLFIELDADGDGIPDSVDDDLDNDSIPNAVDGEDIDTDNDGLVNALDTDSDGDGISDLLEAGADGSAPVDTDSDGIPDFLDLDSNNDGNPDQNIIEGDMDGDGIDGATEGLVDSDGDGILNPLDLDSDNDSIVDSIELTVDTDNDGVPDFLDLDSDNDGLSDLYESGIGIEQVTQFDTDGNGQIDLANVVGANGLLDAVETDAESGVVSFQYQDTDQDGIRDAVDADSDNDQAWDLVETGGADVNSDGQVDVFLDSDGDNVPDSADVDVIGGADEDNDSVADSADADFVEGADDADGDGIVDAFDPDANGDGIADSVATTATANGIEQDTNQNGVLDFLDDQVAATTAVNPPTVAAPSDSEISTGLDGYPGCVLHTGTRNVDLTFLLMLGVALGWLGWRRSGTSQLVSWRK